MKNIIVAYDENRGIGADNDLLWQRDLPADLHHFKELTTGNTIIMGRNTYESIGRPLPNRQNIVVSSTIKPTDGIEVARSLEEAYRLSKHEEIFVIGGARLYEAALETVDRLYITEVHATFSQATVFFPAFSMTDWHETARSLLAQDDRNKYRISFVQYDRR